MIKRVSSVYFLVIATKEIPIAPPSRIEKFKENLIIFIKTCEYLIQYQEAIWQEKHPLQHSPCGGHSPHSIPQRGRYRATSWGTTSGSSWHRTCVLGSPSRSTRGRLSPPQRLCSQHSNNALCTSQDESLDSVPLWTLPGAHSPQTGSQKQHRPGPCQGDIIQRTWCWQPHLYLFKLLGFRSVSVPQTRKVGTVDPLSFPIIVQVWPDLGLDSLV